MCSVLRGRFDGWATPRWAATVVEEDDRGGASDSLDTDDAGCRVAADGYPYVTANELYRQSPYQRGRTCAGSRTSRPARRRPWRWNRRARLLAGLGEPHSAATLAARIGSTRQKVNYHLRALEAHGLVVVTGERRHGGLVERLLVASAASYVVSPAALGAAGADPARAGDRLGPRYLVALAARIIREVAALLREDERTATFTLDATVGLPSPTARVAFAEDLARAVTAVVQRHHVDGGLPHRMVVAAHPIPEEEPA